MVLGRHTHLAEISMKSCTLDGVGVDLRAGVRAWRLTVFGMKLVNIVDALALHDSELERPVRETRRQGSRDVLERARQAAVKELVDNSGNQQQKS